MKSLTILTFLVLVAVCAAKMKCGVGVSSTCPLMSVPCPKNPVCPKGSHVKKDGNGCCCEKKPTKCGKNEYWGPCGRNSCEGCALLFRNIACKPFCQPGCQCLEGHRRDNSGQCIPVKDCKPNCPANEVYSACNGKPSCQPTCLRPSPACTKECVKGCICASGYIRDDNGRCILKKNCSTSVTPSTQICPANEVYTASVAHCGATCAEPNGVVRCTRIAVKGCVCAKGLVRDNGKCIPASQCPGAVTTTSTVAPTPNICPAGENYSKCSGHCGATCAQPDPARVRCTKICKEGCLCAKGLVRHNGKCIPASQCPGVATTPPANVCKANEAFNTCGTACQPSCNTPNPICTLQCVQGCMCASGYVRGADGVCILKSKCPSIKVCPANEIFSECRASCQVRCNGPVFKCSSACVSGCVCKSGYIRGEDGKSCIPKDKCFPRGVVCKANEVYKCFSPCQQGCVGLTGCPPITDPDCKKGCMCAPGFVISNGNCIAKKDCPTPSAEVCPAGEVYNQSNAHCQPTCAQPNGVVRCTKNIVKGCVCAKGLVRENGKCIKPSQCKDLVTASSTKATTPSAQVCPANEAYTACGARCQKTCSSPNPMICPAICAPGCLCKDGLVRAADGSCVVLAKCSSIETSTKATTPSSQVCPANEVYSSCSAHCGKTCKYQDAVPCTKNCVKGCVCAAGLVRENGKCIKPSQCPATTTTTVAPQACAANEKWSNCDWGCNGCIALNPLIACSPPRNCSARCVCIDGYRKDSSQKCIKEELCCPANEVFTQCGRGCDTSCSQPDRSKLICKKSCFKGCVCANGYVRQGARCIKASLCAPLPREEVAM